MEKAGPFVSWFQTNRLTTFGVNSAQHGPLWPALRPAQGCGTVRHATSKQYMGRGQGWPGSSCSHGAAQTGPFDTKSCLILGHFDPFPTVINVRTALRKQDVLLKITLLGKQEH